MMSASKVLEDTMKQIKSSLIFLAIAQMTRWREMLRNALEREGILDVFETYYEPRFKKIYTTYMNEWLDLMKPEIKEGEEILANLVKNALRQTSP